MNNYPHIKILILNWNGEKIIENCLNSVQKIKYNNYSIDVIDNGSSDQSNQIIIEKFPNIKLHMIGKNIGYSKAYNKIFNKLKNNNFEYYLILNNDVIVEDNLLNELYNTMNKYGDNHIYGPKIYYSNNNFLWYGGGYFNKFLGVTLHDGINKNESNYEYKTRKTKYVSGCCMLIKKKTIEELDGFDEIYTMYFEDVDLCYRASNISSFSYVSDSCSINHEVSYSLGKNSLYKKYIKIISQIKFIYKHNYKILFLLSLLINIIILPFYILINLNNKLFRL
tara:strand:- start:29 stop:868 length:840 start_codon:yes stop_codon:yes gene_type:complete